MAPISPSALVFLQVVGSGSVAAADRFAIYLVEANRFAGEATDEGLAQPLGVGGNPELAG